MSKKILLFIFSILLVGFLFHYWISGQAVYGDGIYYWMLTRSVGIDRDLHLNDEMGHHYSWAGNNTREKPSPIPKETDDLKRLAFHLPIGPSIFFLPWFLMGDVFAKFFSFFHRDILVNGYSDAYQITVGVGVVAYTMVGIICVYTFLRKFYSSRVCWFAVVFVLFASNLFYYTSLDILNSHAISFMLSSILVLLLYYFFYEHDQRSKLAFIIGLVYGLQIMTRTQDALFLVPIILVFISQWKSIKPVFVVVFLLGSLLSLFPQLFIWMHFYGGLISVPYSQAEKTFDFFHPHLLGLLINYKTGVLFYSPILLFSFIGLFFLFKKDRLWGFLGIIMISIEYYLVASWVAWDQAASYGARMLISCMPFFMLGVAEIVETVNRKKIILFVGLLLVFINMSGILFFHLYLKDPSVDMGVVTKERTLRKIYNIWR